MASDEEDSVDHAAKYSQPGTCITPVFTKCEWKGLLYTQITGYTRVDLASLVGAAAEKSRVVEIGIDPVGINRFDEDPDEGELGDDTRNALSNLHMPTKMSYDLHAIEQQDLPADYHKAFNALKQYLPMFNQRENKETVFYHPFLHTLQVQLKSVETPRRAIPFAILKALNVIPCIRAVEFVAGAEPHMLVMFGHESQRPGAVHAARRHAARFRPYHHRTVHRQRARPAES